jgi:hypothetical protein
MKTASLLFLAVLLSPACAPRQQPGGTAAPKAATPAPAATAARSHTGRVASVKPELRFVVLDFAVSGVPGDGTVMAVYRAGQKVGEIRVTGPSVGTNTAADITAGEAQIGDEVRDL